MLYERDKNPELYGYTHIKDSKAISFKVVQRFGG